jgi:hypothetical protein
MKPAHLVSQLLALPHVKRIRRLIEVGAQSLHKPELSALLTAWEKGDWQERQWSLFACWGSKENARLARLVYDPSRSVSNLAIKLLASMGQDEQITQVLLTLPHRRCRKLLVYLRRCRRTAPIESFVHELKARGDSAILRHFPDKDVMDTVAWRRRAASQPAETTTYLVQALDASEQPDGLLIQAGRVVLEMLSSTTPDLALLLLRSLLCHVPLHQLPITLLTAHRPNEVADLILASSSVVHVDLHAVVRRLAPQRLLALVDRQPSTLPDPARWLRDLDPPVRATVFQRFGVGWRDKDGCVPSAILALIPGAMRLAEARRHLALPILATRPLLLAEYARFLPWDEARTRLEGLLQHPEAEMRVAAWSALIGAVRFQSARTGELLKLIRQRKNEQDPVRLAFLTGVADLPPSRWSAEHLDDLAGMAREALDATDLSHISTHELSRLLWRLLPRQTDWSVRQLAILFRERGAVFYLTLEQYLTEADARRVEKALELVYASWKEKNRGGWLVWMAQCLGCRLKVCTRLLADLRDLLKGDRDLVALPAHELLRKHLPGDEYNALLETLLKRDRGWAAIPSVFQHLYRSRQDLLQSFLDQPYIRGRLGKRDLIHYIPVNGHDRLTAPQQQALGSTLVGLTRLPRGKKFPADSWTVLLALDRLSRLPAADHERLLLLATDARLVIRDSSLRALGRLDAGQGLPTLVEAMGDDRARMAIYAIRAALAELPANRVMPILRAVSMSKVTVAKEVLRLGGEFGGAEAFAWLRELAQTDLHRDVRIALLRALWDHLEQPEAWPILQRAAAEPDGRLLNGVLRIPADNLTAPTRGKLVDLLLGLLTHPEPTVRLAVLQRFAEMPVPDPKRRLFERALPMLSSILPDERAAAGEAIIALSTASDASRLARATKELLPNRKPLSEWLDIVTRTTSMNRSRLGKVARAMLNTLRTDPLTVCWQPVLATVAEGIAGLRRFLDEINRGKERLHVDGFRALEDAIRRLSANPERAALTKLELYLAEQTDEQMRRLALTTLQTIVCDGQGWNKERLERLERYRADSSLLVAGAAQFVFPPEEPGPKN